MLYPLRAPDQRLSAVEPNPNLADLEAQVLDFWDREQTFQQSLDARSAGENGANEFVFYDGPPFANGLPHYGHLLTGYVKDIVPRYKTMRGFKVNRVFGWDCHGLPPELEVETELGIENKSQIEQMGIAAFNDACRRSVLRYVDDWKGYVRQQARWVDFDNGYKTLDLNYMESIIWAFKELYNKGLIYEGFKVLPYCWHDQTPLSNHELRMDEDVYQNRQDQAVTVGVHLQIGAEAGHSGLDEVALIWTTTPWTLLSNHLIAVGADIEYWTIRPSQGEFRGQNLLLAQARIEHYRKEIGEDFEVLARRRGQQLAGLQYKPMFPYFAGQAGGWEIVVADFVSTEEGTGLVHLAPYGEDDMEVITERGLKLDLTVDEAGLLNENTPDYRGQHVFESNAAIIRDLKQRSGPIKRLPTAERPLLFRAESYLHSYPHCWRCRNPLIYKPVSSWFVNVQKIKARMLEANQEINWIPANVRDGQFGKWLQNARDWSISRNRYWGSPIPIWKSDDPQYPRIEVYGSIAELEAAFGVKVTDLHRPFIDQLVRPNPDDPTGKSLMRRTAEVLDCWFESGSMPFAQKHYPFENRQWFDTHFPGDFIVEYIGQTRGWFYTMHVMALALFDCRAFSNCLCHGIILGNDGQKMSKSLKNYPNVADVFGRDGSDAMRWFLMSSSILKGGNLKVTAADIREAARQVILPFWSAYYFFTLYANAANGQKGYRARPLEPRELHALNSSDRYILAKTRQLVERTTELMDAFNISDTAVCVKNYLEVLNNWYIRTNRERFWQEDANAFNTLWTCLEYLTRVSAPLLPMVCEVIYQGLTGQASVHLQDWPDLARDRVAELSLLEDADLVEVCDYVREIVSVGMSLRKANQIRVRQPLKRLSLLVQEPSRLEAYRDLMAAELNVKTVELINVKVAEARGFTVQSNLIINARELGPRIGSKVQAVIRAAKAGQHVQTSTGISVKIVLADTNETIELFPTEYRLENTVTRNTDRPAGPSGANRAIDSRALSQGGFAVLDLELTEDLILEGLARDLIREIQDQRKKDGFLVTDRIDLQLNLDNSELSAAKKFAELIKQETLTLRLQTQKIAPEQESPKIIIRKASLEH
jgi:isoleucyl-tRNA synthetase